MKISELFFSIQGEGKRIGCPSYFIRTNYCNLRCKFSGGNLCDSYYTSWFPEDDYNRGDIALSEIINDYKIYGARDIVITGGEPTIHLKEINALCSEIKKLNSKVFITVETNGTFIGDFIDYINLISISPKLKSSVPIGTEFEKIHEQNRINIDVFKEYNENYKKGLYDIQWKFVITNESDVNEVFELRDQVGFDENDIFLMPEGITKKDLEHNRSMTMELCKKYNLNYTDRLQVLVWGDKRGV